MRAVCIAGLAPYNGCFRTFCTVPNPAHFPDGALGAAGFALDDPFSRLGLHRRERRGGHDGREDFLYQSHTLLLGLVCEQA